MFISMNSKVAAVMPEDIITRCNIPAIQIYAHGRLETMLGFDIICTDSILTASLFNGFITDSEVGDFEFQDTVLTPEGTPLHIHIICWKPLVPGPHQVKGLAFIPNDDEARRYAKDKSLRRPTMI